MGTDKQTRNRESMGEANEETRDGEDEERDKLHPARNETSLADASCSMPCESVASCEAFAAVSQERPRSAPS